VIDKPPSSDQAPTPPEAPAELGRQVGSSAGWSALNAAVLRVSSFLISLVIARLVSPHDFGVFAVAITVFNIVISIAELGVSSAIVREPKRTREIAPTVFTLSVVTSLALTAIMVAFASTVARELGDVDAASSVRVLSLVVLLSGFSAVPAALLSRDFMQRARFMTDAAFFVASTVVMLVLVLLGHPIMGLAVSRVVGQLVIVVAIMWIAPEKYAPGFIWKEAKALLAFGLPLAGASLVGVAVANVDFVVVGRTLGATSLGYYSLAFNISGWPVTIFSAVLVSVTLPILSRVRESPPELVRHLRAGLSAVTALSFPVCALFTALAAPLIDCVYGEKWHEAWKALIVLSIFGAARTVLTLFSDLTVALGLTRQLLVIQLAWLAVLTPAMIFGVEEWGIAGAGVAHAAVVVLVVIPMYAYTIRRHSDVPLNWVPSTLMRPFVASCLAGALAYAATLPFANQVLQLVAGLVVGIVAYVVISGRWLRELVKSLRTMYWNKDEDTDGASTEVTTESAGPLHAINVPGTNVTAQSFEQRDPYRIGPESEADLEAALVEPGKAKHPPARDRGSDGIR
jgi:lipopolysaccharide exporter